MGSMEVKYDKLSIEKIVLIVLMSPEPRRNQKKNVDQSIAHKIARRNIKKNCQKNFEKNWEIGNKL